MMRPGPVMVAFGLLAFAYLAALPLDFISIDSAELSQVSREVLERRDFLHLTYFGRPYLNKPPLVFWLVAGSEALFGDSRVAYRLPSVLAFIAAAFVARWLSGERRLSGAPVIAPVVTIFATTILALQMIFDVRTDTLLVGCMALAFLGTWRYLQAPTVARAALLGLFIGLGMLAKGPIVPVLCAIAASAELAARAKWRLTPQPLRPLLRPAWLIALVVAAIVIAPFCYGQYEQHGWNGVRFFLWTHSFGRITGASSWDNRRDIGPLFFVHTSAWQYLPWTPLVLVGLVRTVRRLRRGQAELMDGFLAGGFLVGLLAIELSRYKLPHYFYPVYPLGVVLVAEGFAALQERMRRDDRFADRTSSVSAALVFAAAAFALVTPFFFPAGSARQITTSAAALAALWVSRKASAVEHRAVVAVALVGIVLHLQLLPSLFSFHSGLAAARIIGTSDAPCVSFRIADAFMPDALARPVPELAEPSEVRAKASTTPLWVFTSGEGKRELEASGLVVEKEWALAELPGSVLTPRQLLPSVRRESATVNYLLYGRFGS